MKRFLLIMVAFAATIQAAFADKAIDKLQAVSVTVKAGTSQGSGTLFTRTRGEETITFVWTAGHVVEHLRSTREIVLNGAKKTVTEFQDAAIVQEFREDGRRIGEIKMDAKVIRYSDAEHGEDLALLQVRKKNFTKDTTEFYLDGDIPEVGTSVYHVGSLLGQFGANSLTDGLVSQIGRVIKLDGNDVVFDQTTATAFPGSSGGGIFLKNNSRYIGMLVRGSSGGGSFNFYVPVRRMKTWAEKNHVLWALDASITLPSDSVLQSAAADDATTTVKATQSDSPGEDFAWLEKVYGLQTSVTSRSIQAPTESPSRPVPLPLFGVRGGGAEALLSQ